MTSKTLKIACAVFGITVSLAGLGYASGTVTTLSDVGILGSPRITRLILPPLKPVETPQAPSITPSETAEQTVQPKVVPASSPDVEKVSPETSRTTISLRTLAVITPDQADDTVSLPSANPLFEGRIALVEGGVQLRKRPDIDAPRIEILKSGSELDVVKSDGRWLYVTTKDGKTGYVHGRLVVNDKAAQ